jgi:hypothetical protein
MAAINQEIFGDAFQLDPGHEKGIQGEVTQVVKDTGRFSGGYASMRRSPNKRCISKFVVDSVKWCSLR